MIYKSNDSPFPKKEDKQKNKGKIELSPAPLFSQLFGTLRF